MHLPEVAPFYRLSHPLSRADGVGRDRSSQAQFLQNDYIPLHKSHPRFRTYYREHQNMRLEITWYTEWDGSLTAKWRDSAGAPHHNEGRAQDQPAEERGGTTVGTEIPGLQIRGESGSEAAVCANSSSLL
jgi:hypothetical protein